MEKRRRTVGEEERRGWIAGEEKKEKELIFLIYP